MGSRDYHKERSNRKQPAVKTIKSPDLSGKIKVFVKPEGMSGFFIFANTAEEAEQKKHTVLEKYNNRNKTYQPKITLPPFNA